MLKCENRIVEFPNRYQMVPVAGTTDQFDLIPVPGKITKEGQPLNDIFFEEINTYFVKTDDLIAKIPSGLICMWSGLEVPLGWYLCDGQNGTPDLRNRFIVGSGDEYEVGNTGGEKEVSLTVEQIPAHSHKYTDVAPDGGAAGTGAGHPGYITTYTKNTETTGGGQAHENRPPYYALAFIMKA